MSQAAEVNADMLAFWNGQGGHTWVDRQAHTDSTLQSVSDAMLAQAAPVRGEQVLDVGCGCGASTLDFARAVGPTGFVEALDISGPMLAEAERRAQAAAITNIKWRQADAASCALDPYDLLISNFGLMFFEAFDCELDIAAGRGIDEAVIQSTRIGAINSWLRDQPDAVRHAAAGSIRESLGPFEQGLSVRLPGAVWIVSSTAAA